MVSPIDRLKQIVQRLRAPDGCPWDREQTHESLKPHVIEECYELIDAIDEKDDQGMQEELGDLLLQVVLHA
jgi:tetrapyrrole methylase family protein / MazG family protein